MEFKRTGANQNVDADFVEMCCGISEDLLGKLYCDGNKDLPDHPISLKSTQYPEG